MKGSALRERRQRLRLTQTQMAQKLGISMRTYHRLEAGSEPIRAHYSLAVQMIEMLSDMEGKGFVERIARRVVQELDQRK